MGVMGKIAFPCLFLKTLNFQRKDATGQIVTELKVKTQMCCTYKCFKSKKYDLLLFLIKQFRTDEKAIIKL